jgi:hypothetical protein
VDYNISSLSIAKFSNSKNLAKARGSKSLVEKYDNPLVAEGESMSLFVEIRMTKCH